MLSRKPKKPAFPKELYVRMDPDGAGKSWPAADSDAASLSTSSSPTTLGIYQLVEVRTFELHAVDVTP